MVQSFRKITPGLARKLRLIMTDVDGTLLLSGELAGPESAGAISRLQESGIIVGLVSGRSATRLEHLAYFTGAVGPIIAENGGIAKLGICDEPIELGYSRRPALEALEKLESRFPEAITVREDNKNRLIDISFRADGIPVDELRKHVTGVQLLDSGYMLHLLQEGISKGGTMVKILDRIGLSPDEIMVFGDSVTDISLFEAFPHSVMIVNPSLTEEQTEPVRKAAAYISSLTCGEGFAEVAAHIVDLRAGII